jgi:serine/threonine protein kinase
MAPVFEKFRAKALDLLVRIAGSSRQSSGSLFIHGVVMDPEPFQTGPYADVFRGTHDGQQVALKRLRFAFSEASQGQIVRRNNRFSLEILILVWGQLKHPYILQFLGIHSDKATPLVFIVSPWMDAGTLGNIVQDRQYKANDVHRLVCHYI